MTELYLTVAKVAELLGWTRPDDSAWTRKVAVRRARRWLSRCNALVKRGGVTVTTAGILARELPELWARISGGFADS